jgi:Pyridine nucleotide-disulphide oxidoreductase
MAAAMDLERGRPARMRAPCSLPGAGSGPRSDICADELHRIVVVGGGAAGSELVTRLGDRLGRRGRAQVALVECARTHLWKPLLHEVAAGSLDPGEYEVSTAPGGKGLLELRRRQQKPRPGR